MRIAAAALVAGLACGLPPGERRDPEPVVPPTLASCVGRSFTPAPSQGFRHAANDLLVALGSPGHSMQDVLAVEGTAIAVAGKFAYGTVSKDLEDESVRVHLDDCSGWRALGDFTTDSDGRILVAVPDVLPVGLYDVRLEVLGDASVAPGRLWILPAGTRLAVSDIDGTLTTSDGELAQDLLADFFSPIYTGEYEPVAYPAAAELTHALVDRGFVLVYLTGRPYWLTDRTREWLAAGGFAAGALHTTDSNAEALPIDASVGAFKLAFLRRLAEQGFVLDEAYGNATTDIYAYAGAALPPTRTFVIGPHGGEGATQAVVGSWAERAAELRALSPIEQPFSR